MDKQDGQDLFNNASFGRLICFQQNRIASRAGFFNNIPVEAQLHPVAAGIQPQSGDVLELITEFPDGGIDSRKERPGHRVEENSGFTDLGRLSSLLGCSPSSPKCS